MTAMTLLARGIAAIALVNLLSLVALQLAYAWHHWLKPMRDDLRARQREFERLLWQPSFDGPSPRVPRIPVEPQSLS
jgi:hypothetical protein